MNLWFRMLWIYLGTFFKPVINAFADASELNIRVLPTDLDINMHMNNGRYLTHMDLGRFDLLLRSGLWKFVRKTRSVPILGSATIRYRMSLDAFEQYKLVTKVVAWDEKWIYIEQRFIKLNGARAGAVAAIGLVKGSFYHQAQKRMVPTAELLEDLGLPIGTTELPDHIKTWQESEEKIRQLTA